MATFNLPAQAITANVEFDSPDVAAPNFTRAFFQLTDPSGTQWPATRDNTRHIKKWGLQVSHDNGSTWAWGPVHQEEPAPGLPFGSRDKSGGLPGIGVEGSLGVAGTRLRLAILTDANVTLGVSITVV